MGIKAGMSGGEIRRFELLAVRQAARRHWALAILLSCGLALRVLAQVAYQPAIIYIDSDRYLRGIGALDPLGYLALLWPVQHAIGLAAVAGLQHFMGLCMACTIYLVLLRRGAWRWAAALAAAPVLLDAYQLHAEQTIMSDVMFEALIVAGLASLLWPTRPAVWHMVASGFLIGFASDVREVGQVLIAPALAFALLSADRWRLRLRYGVALTAAFAIPLTAYMTVQYLVNGHFQVTLRGTYIYYGRAATAADCATLRIPADERGLCPTRQEIESFGIDALGGNPDYPPLKYRPPAGMIIQAMVDRFDLAVLTQQPASVAGAIDRDFLKLFAFTRDGSAGDPPISRWQFQATYPTYPPYITQQYVAQIHPGGSPPTAIKPVARLLRGYQLNGGFTPGPLFAVAVVAGLVGTCCIGGPRGRHTALANACFLFTAVGLAVLLLSDAAEFSWRYQLPALVLLPPAGLLGIMATTARVKFEIAVWQHSQAAGRHAGNVVINGITGASSKAAERKIKET